MALSRNRRSRYQEDAAAQRLGGRRTPGSGNGWAVKNDVRTPTVSIEFKYTDKKSYPLRLSELLQAEKNALLDGGRDMAFIVELGGREWAVTTREYFEERIDGDS